MSRIFTSEELDLVENRVRELHEKHGLPESAYNETLVAINKHRALLHSDKNDERSASQRKQNQGTEPLPPNSPISEEHMTEKVQACPYCKDAADWEECYHGVITPCTPNCQQCHGTGEVKVIANTVGKAHYHQCFGKGFSSVPHREEDLIPCSKATLEVDKCVNFLNKTHTQKVQQEFDAKFEKACSILVESTKRIILGTTVYGKDHTLVAIARKAFSDLRAIGIDPYTFERPSQPKAEVEVEAEKVYRWVKASERLPRLDLAKDYACRFTRVPNSYYTWNVADIKRRSELAYEIEWLEEIPSQRVEGYNLKDLPRMIEIVKSNITEYGRLVRDWKVENNLSEPKKWGESWAENKELLKFLQSLPQPSEDKEVAVDQFCKIYSKMYGEPIDSLDQVSIQTLNGHQLLEFINDFNKFLQSKK